MNVLDRDAQRMLLKLMCLDNGIRDIVEITDHSPNTVRRHLARFGEALAAAHDRLVRGMTLERIEVDELWSYVYAKRQKRVKPGSKTAPKDLGEFYTWTAICPDTKLFIGWHVGQRDHKTGMEFFADISSRIANYPMITSDGWGVYPDLIQRTFGADTDHVVLEKEFKSWWNRSTGDSGQIVEKFEKVVSPSFKGDLALATTSFVERLNASIRNYNSRFRRKTYKFSKKLENHVHSQAIFGVYYNFVKAHGGFKGPERHYTPAMKAGLTDRVWTYDDLLDQIDQYWTNKAVKPILQLAPAPQYIPLAVGETSSLPYFVMYSREKLEAKVHKGTCRNCRNGLGRLDGVGTNQWYAFRTDGEARICAEALAPYKFSDCSICVTGHYSGARRNPKRIS